MLAGFCRLNGVLEVDEALVNVAALHELHSRGEQVARFHRQSSPDLPYTSNAPSVASCWSGGKCLVNFRKLSMLFHFSSLVTAHWLLPRGN